jgi:hypothetical protein
MATQIKIDSYVFNSMSGDFGNYGDVVEDETRPGIDGHTFRKLGKRGERFQIETRSTFRTASLTTRAKTDYQALQGRFVNITDWSGTTYKMVFIHAVTVNHKDMLSSTNNDNFIVICKWTLQRAG